MQRIKSGTASPYSLEIRENDKRLSYEAMPDPFHNTTIHPRGWRAAWAILRRRYKLTVIVGADHDIVEAVCELDSNYLGEPGSDRRRAWNEHMEGTLGDFAARLAEHEGESS